jgi:hypothetical protein
MAGRLNYLCRECRYSDLSVGEGKFKCGRIKFPRYLDSVACEFMRKESLMRDGVPVIH